MQSKIAAALCATFILTACGGGGGASVPNVGNAPGGTAAAPPWTPAAGAATDYTPTSSNAQAITAVNSFADALDLFSSTETSQADTAQAAAVLTHTAGVPKNSGCQSGVEFDVPDLNGDANSTESQYFYDTACTEMARDLVRIFTSTGTNSEVVTSTEQQYPFAPAGTTLAVVATADRVKNYTSPAFNSNGYPSIAQGYYASDSGFLDVGNYKTVISDTEFSMSPQSSTGVNTFCSDGTGYNALAVGSGNVFGWAGGIAGGSRTVNSDGSVTWTSTRSGTAYVGPTGSLSISVASPNSVCPFSAPMTSIVGGTQVGTQTIPITATYLNGLLENLAITGATLGKYETLNVVTTSKTSPGNADFITGTIANKTGTIAEFNVDAFGDGTLNVVASGNQYVITSWHVRIVSNS